MCGANNSDASYNIGLDTSHRGVGDGMFGRGMRRKSLSLASKQPEQGTPCKVGVGTKCDETRRSRVVLDKSTL